MASPAVAVVGEDELFLIGSLSAPWRFLDHRREALPGVCCKYCKGSLPMISQNQHHFSNQLDRKPSRSSGSQSMRTIWSHAPTLTAMCRSGSGWGSSWPASRCDGCQNCNARQCDAGSIMLHRAARCSVVTCCSSDRTNTVMKFSFDKYRLRRASEHGSMLSVSSGWLTLFLVSAICP